MKYVIYAPSHSITGGQECLHQLCDALNNQGKDAYMVYHPNVNSDIPVPYRKYNVKSLQSTPIDNKNTTVILYESQFWRALDFKTSPIVFWWLSVDNHYKGGRRMLSFGSYLRNRRGIVEALNAWFVKWYYLFIRNEYVFNKVRTERFWANFPAKHLYQSEYARLYLEAHGNKFTSPLKDYLYSTFIDLKRKRNDVLLYNPKKGFEIIKVLKNKLPMFDWIPIENMKYDEIGVLMNQSKIYIDFGNHPGRDKLPREAVSCGMYVITGLRGSAGNDVDINVKIKFDDYNIETEKLKNEIQDIFQNFETRIIEMSEYKTDVMNGKRDFMSQVQKAFN